jgi:hypothetical protein
MIGLLELEWFGPIQMQEVFMELTVDTMPRFLPRAQLAQILTNVK